MQDGRSLSWAEDPYRAPRYGAYSRSSIESGTGGTGQLGTAASGRDIERKMGPRSAEARQAKRAGEAQTPQPAVAEPAPEAQSARPAQEAQPARAGPPVTDDRSLSWATDHGRAARYGAYGRSTIESGTGGTGQLGTAGSGRDLERKRGPRSAEARQAHRRAGEAQTPVPAHAGPAPVAESAQPARSGLTAGSGRDIARKFGPHSAEARQAHRNGEAQTPEEAPSAQAESAQEPAKDPVAAAFERGYVAGYVEGRRAEREDGGQAPQPAGRPPADEQVASQAPPQPVQRGAAHHATDDPLGWATGHDLGRRFKAGRYG